jgi:hypothetical protein
LEVVVMEVDGDPAFHAGREEAGTEIKAKINIKLLI